MTAASTKERQRKGDDYEVVTQYPPPPGVTRRSFLMSWAGLAWTTFGAATGVLSIGIVRSLMPNVLFEPPKVFKAGRPDAYPEWDRVYEQFKQAKGVWLVKLRRDFNNKPTLVALSVVCTHLGCTPNFLPGAFKIKCPCHGSGFRINGVNFEGPAPRPLERYRIYLDPVDGQVVVDKSKKFFGEKDPDGPDGWGHPDSFLDLSAV